MNKVIEGNNKYCVPAVISILTGKSTDEAERAIRRVYPQYNGRELEVSIIVRVISSLNMKAESIETLNDASLFITFHYISKQDGMYLVLVPKHIVAIEVKKNKVFLCDNHTKEPISAESSSRLGQKVNRIYKIVELPKPKILFVESKADSLFRHYELKSHWDNNQVTVEGFIINCIE